MGWTETRSRPFAARHEEEDTDDVEALLDTLEDFRLELADTRAAARRGHADRPRERPYQLTLAQPWLPLARMFAAPGRAPLPGRLVLSSREPPRLGAEALEERVQVAGSREALRRHPARKHAPGDRREQPGLATAVHPGSPSVATCAPAGRVAASFFMVQPTHLRRQLLRRLREGLKPSFRPRPGMRAAHGTVFAADEMVGEPARAFYTACRSTWNGARPLIEKKVFKRPFVEVEHAAEELERVYERPGRRVLCPLRARSRTSMATWARLEYVRTLELLDRPCRFPPPAVGAGQGLSLQLAGRWMRRYEG